MIPRPKDVGIQVGKDRSFLYRVPEGDRDMDAGVTAAGASSPAEGGFSAAKFMFRSCSSSFLCMIVSSYVCVPTCKCTGIL